MIKIHLSRLMGEQKLKISDVANITKEQDPEGKGLHRNGITKLYYDKTDGVKFDTLDKLCKALNCSVGDLIEHEEDKEKA
jgi:putative transcriptional regulator